MIESRYIKIDKTSWAYSISQLDLRLLIGFGRAHDQINEEELKRVHFFNYFYFFQYPDAVQKQIVPLRILIQSWCPDQWPRQPRSHQLLWP